MLEIFNKLKFKCQEFSEKLDSHQKGDIELSHIELDEMLTELKYLKNLLTNEFIDNNKKIIKNDIDMDLICKNCDNFQVIDKKLSIKKESIFNLDITKFTKQDLINIIEENIKNNPEYLLELSLEFNSTILHKIVYAIYQNKYIVNQERSYYIFFLQFLKTKPEYTILVRHKNCKGKTAGETFEKICEYKNNKDYTYILYLLGIQKGKVNKDKELSKLTIEYHNLQEKLFKYLSKEYYDITLNCVNCKKQINIVDDFQNIGKIICADKNRDWLIDVIKKIINLRTNVNMIYEEQGIGNLQSGIRHKEFVNKFLELLNSFYE